MSEQAAERRRPFRVVLLRKTGDYLWGTYLTRSEADETCRVLKDRGEPAQVRTFKRDKAKR